MSATSGTSGSTARAPIGRGVTLVAVERRVAGGRRTAFCAGLWATFLAGAFLALARFWAVDCVAVLDFLAVGFLAVFDFLAAFDFLAVGFLAVDFFGVAFFLAVGLRRGVVRRRRRTGFATGGPAGAAGCSTTSSTTRTG